MALFHILYLSSQFPTKLNPQIGVFSLERVRALVHAGCQVAVVAPVLMTPPPGLIRRPSQLTRWMAQMRWLPVHSRVDEIEVHSPRWFCPPKPAVGWYISAFLHAQIRRAAMQAAEKLKPQVILSSWLPDGVAACQLGERLGLPVISIADGTDVNEWPVKYPWWRYARDILNEKASALIYVSEALRLAGNAHGLHPPRDLVIHNAVDVQAFMRGPEGQGNETFLILAVGRMVPVKGYHVLLQAFAEFAAHLGRPARLRFVGDGPLRQALQEQAAVLGISQAVQFIGAVPPERMASYYQAADLLCLPSFSEGLPCVAVEAMACGKPVVASNVGGVPELVDTQSGILVPPGDPKVLCEALLQAARQNWDSQAIRQKIVEGFSWVQWTEKLFRVIHLVSEEQSKGSRLDEREKLWPAWR